VTAVLNSCSYYRVAAGRVRLSVLHGTWDTAGLVVDSADLLEAWLKQSDAVRGERSPPRS